MNRIVSYAPLFGGFLMLVIIKSALYGNVDLNPLDESLVIRPQKLNKRKVQEDLAYSCRDLLKETAGLINETSLLNECAGDLAAEVLEGTLNEDKKKLDEISRRIKNLTVRVRRERTYLKNEGKELNKLHKQHKKDSL